MTVTEAAAYARVSVEAITEALESGDLRGARVGRGQEWRIDRVDLSLWVKAHNAARMVGGR